MADPNYSFDPAVAVSTDRACTIVAETTCGGSVGAIPGIPLIASAQLYNGIVSQPYSWQLVSLRGLGTSWAIVSGALPAGLTLNASTGLISGTPTTAGAGVPFQVRASNAYGDDFEILSIAVDAACTSPSPTVNQTVVGTVGKPFIGQLGGTGSGPFTWTVTTANLPAGLTLTASTGVVSGTPTAPFSGVVGFRATNTCGNNTTNVNVTIVAA